MTTAIKRTKRQQAAHEKKIEKLALTLRKFLEERGLWAGCKMFYNGKKVWRKSYDVDDPGDEIDEEDGNPLRYMEYANPDTITINFEESQLHSELNNGTLNHETDRYNWSTTDALTKFFEGTGFYYEQGHAWNLSLFEGGN